MTFKAEKFNGNIVSIANDEGLTVRELMSLLENANPDAKVVSDTWRCIFDARLDAKGPAFDFEPIVVIR